MTDKEKRCMNPACKRLLVDEEIICSRCMRLGWKYTKDIGKAAGVLVGPAVAIATGLNKGKNTKG